MKRQLPTVTLIGADCVDIDRLILAADISSQAFEFADTKLLSSIPSHDRRVREIPPITSTEQYSEFCITRLHEFVETEHVLIIQYDGFILNPDAWTDEFLQYDYIGAPWYAQDRSSDFPKELYGQYIVGNGGFSLRSKRFLDTAARLAREGSIPDMHPEDFSQSIWNRGLFEAAGLKFAPVELAKRFSFEAFDKERIVWDGQFGFHGLRWTDISKWLDTNPEYKEKIDNTLTGWR